MGLTPDARCAVACDNAEMVEHVSGVSPRIVVLALVVALSGGLGTGAIAAAPPAPRLRVEPATAYAGTVRTFAGTGYLANRTVTVYAGPPFSEATILVGSAQSDGRGNFRLRTALWLRGVGRYVAIACQRGCRVKAGAALRITAAATASRPPTSAESTAIRRAALRSLGGSGWRVSAIRVSTIAAKHAYARASVDNVDGVGFEMILRRDRTRWVRIFLGTDGFCKTKAPARVLRGLGFGC
jgi:hypothetical protein